MHHDDNVEAIDTMEAQVVDPNLVNVKGIQSRPGRFASTKSLLKNWQLMSAITLYCVFSLYDTAYIEVNLYLCIFNIFNNISI